MLVNSVLERSIFSENTTCELVTSITQAMLILESLDLKSLWDLVLEITGYVISIRDTSYMLESNVLDRSTLMRILHMRWSQVLLKQCLY